MNETITGVANVVTVANVAVVADVVVELYVAP